jgi:oligoendopeptidase F
MTTERFPFFSPFAKRTFLPSDANLSDPSTVTHFYAQLSRREMTTDAGIEQWLADWSELDSAILETETIYYVQMTCQTDDAQKAERYRHFMEEIEPIIKEWHDRLDRKFVEAIAGRNWEQGYYGVFIRERHTNIRLFRGKNVELEKEEDRLKQEYQAIAAAMTVDHDGREITLQAASKFLLDPDRRLRERFWRLIAERRLKDKDRLDALMSRLIRLRHQKAGNADFESFPEYCYLSQHKFDYFPSDCKHYHAAVKKWVTPVWETILKRRKKVMRLDHLRPWDTSVDPLGRPALKPFEKIDQLFAGCRRIFSHIDPELEQQFAALNEWGVLELDSHKGKAPGGYQATLQEARRPFIFMNAVGLDGDVQTLLHEGGHAFHSLACRRERLLSYRHAPLEFCEVASMSMELIGNEYAGEFYNEDDAKRSRLENLEEIIWTLVWVAVVDAFQHWLYQHPDHTAEERAKEWARIYKHFTGSVVEWDGLEQEMAFLWHRQLHIFELPFYYMEYAIAELGAVQVWRNYRRDPSKTLKQFKRALALGGSKPLPELFAAAGIRFDFSERVIQNAVGMITSQWNGVSEISDVTDIQ